MKKSHKIPLNEMEDKRHTSLIIFPNMHARLFILMLSESQCHKVFSFNKRYSPATSFAVPLVHWPTRMGLKCVSKCASNGLGPVILNNND